MALSVLTGVVFFFVTIFQCTPVSFFWNRAQPGTCIDVHILEGLTYLYSSINAINDFTFGLLPVALIYNLQMDRKTKLLLIPILSMGCIASAAILVRMAYVQEFSNPDFLWATVDIAIWSDTEQGLAITAGCLATLRPLFWHISRRLGWTSVGPSNGPSDGRRYPSRIRRRTPGPFSLITLTNGIHGDASDENLQMDDQKALEAQEKMGTTTVICAERRGERTGRFRIEKWDEAETPVSRESIGLAA
ncbi:hypothetical protein MMC10_006845 [Thelotrema lepadinum]|nr:hypothetical protein [Thelotrema lepadinum]